MNDYDTPTLAMKATLAMIADGDLTRHAAFLGEGHRFAERDYFDDEAD
jgi:hypothetical protein